jgi:hypothetical protein
MFSRKGLVVCGEVNPFIVNINFSIILFLGSNGDSGGPLVNEYSGGETVAHYILFGVVSFGPKICGTVGVPGVYTKVSSYLEWINEIIY